MNCENKNNLLDLYFLEGNGHNHSEIKAHVEACENCREYLGILKQTMNLLDKIDEEVPAPKVFQNILSDVSVSIPKPAKRRTGVELIPILQIAFGEIFLFSLIYFLKIQLTAMPIWKAIQNHWLVQSIGSVGISIILVLLVGSFMTLSIAPILLFESNERKSFS
jgi:hypothetical protein